MFSIALATGNISVLKPSGKDPPLILAPAKLLQGAGLPGGVFNVAQGDKESVDVLLTDPRARAVSFVGSTPIAEYIYQMASAHGKRCQALGGVKNHCILMPDVDMGMATNAITGAAYDVAGERCMALSVMLAVGDKTADELCSRLEKQTAALRVRLGLDQISENEMGPLISSAHRNKVFGHIDSGESQEASLRVGGRRFSVKGHEQGYFVGPVLFDNVTPEMTIYKEKISGSVFSVVCIVNYSSTVELINRHEYGNGTAVFTRDGGRARRFYEEVQAGMVGVNVPIPVSMASHSFGGWKRSIFGALNVYGNDGARFYIRTKTVIACWPKILQDTGATLSMPMLG